MRIDAVPVPGTTGLIGMTFCPGKKDLDLGGLLGPGPVTDPGRLRPRRPVRGVVGGERLAVAADPV